ncbi:MAG TPA: tyrosine-type recombinase/integrase [Solirubrobacterales bacterium]|jgi:integrase|nr:tyrosine-type recombinase/integrase [Solirubrobacterales bacterium]
MPRQEQGIEYYLTPSGEKRYRVRWEEDGKHPSRSFRRLSGEHGARAFYQKIRQLQEAGTRVVEAGSQDLTLAVFAADVWAPRAKRRLAAKTWETDSRIYNKHVLRQLGERPIAQIDVEDLVEWQDSLERAGVGAPTMIKAMTILSSVFREAARRSRSTGVRLNPVVMLEKPSGKRRRRPLVWGPVVVERVRYQLLVNSRRINPGKELAALRDALLVSFTAMTGCRPGEALALRWHHIDGRVIIENGLSGDEIVNRTKTGKDRVAPLLKPLQADLAALRALSGDDPDNYVFRTSEREHWVETDWRNYRSRHFVPALERVEAEWEGWRGDLPRPERVRESVAGLAKTRPYDLGRHTHSALMLASGMSLQRLARIQGHSIRVLDETYSEELAEFQDRAERIDPVEEIEKARTLVWADLDPSIGN